MVVQSITLQNEYQLVIQPLCDNNSGSSALRGFGTPCLVIGHLTLLFVQHPGATFYDRLGSTIPGTPVDSYCRRDGSIEGFYHQNAWPRHS